jgi:hypothetical protein
VAEPVVAEEEARCRRPKRNRRNDSHRSRGPGPWCDGHLARRGAAAPKARGLCAGWKPTPPRGLGFGCALRASGADATEHETSRNGGRAVHGVVPPALEFRRAQHRVGLPREWPPGEARRGHQAGRRDARRWPKPPEDNGRFTPPQGGEPERRRDKRRTRRQAGEAEKRAQGRCCGTRFSARRVAEPGAAEKVAQSVGPGSDRRSPGTAPVGPVRPWRTPTQIAAAAPDAAPDAVPDADAVPAPVPAAVVGRSPTRDAPPPSRRGCPESSGRAPPPRRASGETGRCPRIRRASRSLSACNPT